jgi:hypothetical protein
MMAARCRDSSVYIPRGGGYDAVGCSGRDSARCHILLLLHKTTQPIRLLARAWV